MSLESQLNHLISAMELLVEAVKENTAAQGAAPAPKKKAASKKAAAKKASTTSAPAAETPAPSEAPVAQPAPQPSATPNPNVAPAAAPASASATGEHSYEEVRTRASEVSRQLGPDAHKIVDLLSRFGATRLSALQPDQYPGFLQGLDVLAAGGEV